MKRQGDKQTLEQMFGGGHGVKPAPMVLKNHLMIPETPARGCNSGTLPGFRVVWWRPAFSRLPWITMNRG
jgi:hypothetical protein